MKSTSLLSLGLLLTVAASGWADIVLVQKVEGTGQNGEITVKFKGDRARVDMDKAVSVVTDLNTGDMTTLMHGQKAYMTMSAAATKQIFEQMKKAQPAAAQTPAAADAGLKPTGRKETVNGVETEVYTTQEGGMKATYWIAKDYPNGEKLLAALNKMQKSPAAQMAREMAPQPDNFPGVPVKSEVETKSGQKVVSTLVSAKEEALDDAEFATPADYQSMAMPQIPAGQ